MNKLLKPQPNQSEIDHLRANKVHIANLIVSAITLYNHAYISYSELSNTLKSLSQAANRIQLELIPILELTTKTGDETGEPLGLSYRPPFIR